MMKKFIIQGDIKMQKSNFNYVYVINCAKQFLEFELFDKRLKNLLHGDSYNLFALIEDNDLEREFHQNFTNITVLNNLPEAFLSEPLFLVDGYVYLVDIYQGEESILLSSEVLKHYTQGKGEIIGLPYIANNHYENKSFQHFFFKIPNYYEDMIYKTPKQLNFLFNLYYLMLEEDESKISQCMNENNPNNYNKCNIN